MSQFNEASTTSDVIKGIDLSGKRVVITGATAGLGVETARTMASAGATVTLVGRDEAKLAAALASLQEAVPGASFETALLDLADLDSVREGAADILAKNERIDILINNAGVMACPLQRTAQGHEMQFGTNHLGHFLLTLKLMPAILAAGNSRIINLSSAGHKIAPVNLDDPDYLQRDYQKFQAYGEAKTANALFSVGLDTRFGAQGVTALSVHPGAIVTELGRHLEPVDHAFLLEDRGAGAMTFKEIPAGAATSVWAATAPELEGRGGLYLQDCNIAEPSTGHPFEGVESYAVDKDIAERLWALSVDMVGEDYSAG